MQPCTVVASMAISSILPRTGTRSGMTRHNAKRKQTIVNDLLDVALCNERTWYATAISSDKKSPAIPIAASRGLAWSAASSNRASKLTCCRLGPVNSSPWLLPRPFPRILNGPHAA